MHIARQVPGRDFKRTGTRAFILAASLLAVSSSFGGPLEDLRPGEWYEVPNSRLSSLDPCPMGNCSYSGIEGQSAVIDDWNGGAFATRYGTKGGLIVWGGGHNGYLGNEVYVFDVGQLAWKRVSEPVQAPVCDYLEAELQDGSACSAHTYDYVDYHPGSNSFVKLGSASDHVKGGSGSPRVHLFSLDTFKWRRGERKGGSFLTHTGAASAYDPTRDAFWVVAGYNQPIGMYDPDGNSGAGKWTMYNEFNIDAMIVAAIDPTRDLFVMVDAYGTKGVFAFDLKNPNVVSRITTTGDAAVQSEQGAGFEWDPIEKAFVSWIGGANVYTLKPPSGDWRTQPWVWTRRAPASTNTVTPTAPNSNDTYSRWRYVPAVNAWMVVNRNTDNVFFYRLSPPVAQPMAPVNVTAR
jgi:hypothetical protein